MIKQINTVIKKYKEIVKTGAEYVSVGEVINDLYQLAQDVRIMRLPKDER